jgi:hypothetical protein
MLLLPPLSLGGVLPLRGVLLLLLLGPQHWHAGLGLLLPLLLLGLLHCRCLATPAWQPRATGQQASCA